MKEWLPSLAARKKWTTSNRNFAVGDVVLVINSQTVRGHWPLGRIVAVHPGQDGRVRVVDVKIGDTVFVRSVTTLCAEGAPDATAITQLHNVTRTHAGCPSLAVTGGC